MILIFDTETTCLPTKEKPTEVIEAAWLELDGDLSNINVNSEYCERFKPEGQIDFGAMAVHNIINEDLVDCKPSASFALPEGVNYIIGHSVDYDWGVIGKPDIKRICTLALSRMVWPDTSHTQSALAYFLMEDKAQARSLVKDAHNALADVHICLFILEKIIAKLGIKTIEELYEQSEKARIPTKMSFGKHKGAAIADVPAEWSSWYLRQPDNDPYLVKAFALAKKAKLKELDQDIFDF